MNDISTHLIATEKALKAASEAIACPTMTPESVKALKQAIGLAQVELEAAQQWATLKHYQEQL